MDFCLWLLAELIIINSKPIDLKNHPTQCMKGTHESTVSEGVVLGSKGMPFHTKGCHTQDWQGMVWTCWRFTHTYTLWGGNLAYKLATMDCVATGLTQQKHFTFFFLTWAHWIVNTMHSTLEDLPTVCGIKWWGFSHFCNVYQPLVEGTFLHSIRTLQMYWRLCR